MFDVEVVGDEIATLAARLSSATHRLLTCIRQFDEAEGWHRQGAQSCAHWLTWRIGLDAVTAREKVRVARALGVLPKIDDAFRCGRLSYAQARAVTRVATATNEECVLDIALACTGAQLERICRRFRSATAALSDLDAEAAVDRRFRARPIGAGLVKLEVVVSADEAETLIQAIEHARAELRDRRRSPSAIPSSSPAASAEAPGLPAPPPVRAADALMHVATTYIAASGEASEDESSKTAPATGHQVVIHLDRDLLRSGEDLPAVAASLDDGTPVSAEALRRIACDAGLVAALMSEPGPSSQPRNEPGAATSQVLDIGRRTRAIPTAIRRALWLRDRACRFPGCTNHRFLHGHHVRHWLHGGSTSLNNLVLLCPFHHRQVHEGGFSIALEASGEVRVLAPGGSELGRQPLASTPPSGGVASVDVSRLLRNERQSFGATALSAFTMSSNVYGFSSPCPLLPP